MLCAQAELVSRRLCSVYVAQKAIVWVPYLKRASWVVGWPVLGCYTVLRARARGTLVPMPFLALLHRLTRLLAATTARPRRATPKSCMGGGRPARTFVLLWS